MQDKFTLFLESISSVNPQLISGIKRAYLESKGDKIGSLVLSKAMAKRVAGYDTGAEADNYLVSTVIKNAKAADDTEVVKMFNKLKSRGYSSVDVISASEAKNARNPIVDLDD